MAGSRALALRAYARVGSLPVLRQDALLYAASAIFAVGVAQIAVTADYREWAQIAIAPYVIAALASEGILRWRRHGSAASAEQVEREDEADGSSLLRRSLAIGVLLLCVLLPLALQISWRAHGRPGAQAQPEVAVIERAGDRFAHFSDPYLSHPRTVGISPSNDARSVNADSYFPYLPGMVPFGLLNAVNGPAEVTDARVLLAGFTLLVVLLALSLARSPSRRRWRAFQFLVALPTGALPIVTGGDDLPVIALMLLGLVLVQRRRPLAAGLVLGIAGTLKLTAWPLVILLALAARDEDDQPAPLRYLAAVLVVIVPVLAAAASLGPHAFFENVVMFPLGLTKVHSPAASPLFGQELVTLLPGLKRELTVGLLGGGAIVILLMFARHVPRDAHAATRFAGWALAFVTVIAPATRFGYLIYPANLLVWAYLVQAGHPDSSSVYRAGADLSLPQASKGTPALDLRIETAQLRPEAVPRGVC
ncbi:MAG: glycosyltransferase 87 family protein [Acidimicrobiales bacterium]